MLRNTRASRLAALGATTVALAGCGGSSINNTNITSSGNSPSGPVIYGLNPTYVLNGVGSLETSGLGAGDGSAIYITGATGYKVVSGNGPVAAVANNFGGSIPLGFAPGGTYLNGKNGLAVPTTGQVAFGIYIQQGAIPSGGTLLNVDIDPSQEVLTSSEAPGFQQKFNFTGVTNNALSNSTYQTAPFTLPAPLNTTGLHSFTATVGDAQGQKSQTTFDALVLAPADSAVLVQVMTPHTAGSSTLDPVSGATVTVTNALPGVNGYVAPGTDPTAYPGLTSQTSVSDGSGVAIVFAAPGKQTITVNADGKNATNVNTGKPVTGSATDSQTLVAGQAFATTLDSGGNPAPYAITVAPPGPAAKKIVRH